MILLTNTYRAGILWHIVHATTKSNSEYEMIYDERPWIRVFALDLHRPLLRFGVLRSPRDFGGRPDI